MGGGGGDDGSGDQAQIMRQKAQMQKQKDKRNRKKDKKEEAKDAAALETAMAGGRASIEAMFEEMGADPAEYATSIEAVMSEIMNRIPSGSDNPGTYFEGAPEYAIGRAEAALQGKSMRDLDRIFAPNFEYDRYKSDADDSILNAIEAEDRLEAEQYLDQLLSRGVINESGRTAGVRNLDSQAAKVKALLDQYGTSTIEGGRANARDISNRARSAASQINIGGPKFDPNSYASQLDTDFTSFLDGLETSIRGKITTPNLFDTSGLAAIAGGGQGAGNLKYDRRAVNGLPAVGGENEDEDEFDRIQGAAGFF